jgi:hypothetical protein
MGNRFATEAARFYIIIIIIIIYNLRFLSLATTHTRLYTLPLRRQAAERITYFIVCDVTNVADSLYSSILSDCLVLLPAKHYLMTILLAPAVIGINKHFIYISAMCGPTSSD